MLPVSALVFLVYAWGGAWLDRIGLSLVAHRGYSMARIVGALYVSLEGVLGGDDDSGLVEDSAGGEAGPPVDGHDAGRRGGDRCGKGLGEVAEGGRHNGRELLRFRLAVGRRFDISRMGRWGLAGWRDLVWFVTFGAAGRRLTEALREGRIKY